jgi:alkaline phosphatase D
MVAILVAVGILLGIAVYLAAPTVAKECITTGETDPVLVELDPYLIKELRGGSNGKGGKHGADAGMPELIKDAKFMALVKKHKLRLFSGPMVGAISDTSARIWVRTAGPAKVEVVVGEGAQLGNAKKGGPVTTMPEDDFTAVVEVKGLKPFTAYHYDVKLDGAGTQAPKLPFFRTAPAAGQKAVFSVGFGGGARYNPPKEHMWKTIEKEGLLGFLFLGDNVYIDMPARRDVARLHYYRRQLRAEFRSLCSKTAVYSIYDDHDLGANDCAGGPDIMKPDWKFPSWKVFKQNWVNPYYGGGDKQPGCWSHFSLGDVDFIMTDGRYYRDYKKGKTMLGPVQKKWLLERLAASKGTFKVIASGTLWTEFADKGGKDSWWGVKQEREEIFSLIDKNRIPGVLLISADRHRTEIWKIERPKGYTLYEFESSKLTNNHTHKTRKEAVWSFNQGNYFALFQFDLTKSDPVVTFKAVNIEGKVLKEFPLKRSQLQAK